MQIKSKFRSNIAFIKMTSTLLIRSLLRWKAEIHEIKGGNPLTLIDYHVTLPCGGFIVKEKWYRLSKKQKDLILHECKKQIQVYITKLLNI